MPMVTRSRRMPPSPSGMHFLSCPSVAVELVRSSGVGAGDLVVDVGAGAGAITAPLAATGARVLAVERDPRLARRLERVPARGWAGLAATLAAERTPGWPPPAIGGRVGRG
jgi:protein-L-isoaspartate O-methyltransferase